MTEKSKCSINFQMKVETEKTDTVYISGNIPELGCWDPYKSLLLETDEQNYPLWISTHPLILEYGHFDFHIIFLLF